MLVIGRVCTVVMIVTMRMRMIVRHCVLDLDKLSCVVGKMKGRLNSLCVEGLHVVYSRFKKAGTTLGTQPEKGITREMMSASRLESDRSSEAKA